MLGFRSIKHKMMVGFTLIFALVIILGLYNFYSTNLVNEETETIIDHEVPALISNQQVAFTIANRISIVRDFLATGEDLHKKKFEEYTKTSEQYIAMIEDTIADNTFDFEQITALQEWEENIHSEVFDSYANRQRAQARANFQSLATDGEEIMKYFENYALNREDEIRSSGDEVIESGQMTMIVATSISVIVVIVGIVIALGTARTIANPLREAMARMNAMADGDLSQAALETNLRDEIGQLIHATNLMNENNQNLLHHIHRVSEQINEESDALTNSAGEVKAGAEQVAVTMEELARGAENQAEHSNNLASMMNQFLDHVEEANESGEAIFSSSNNVLDLTNAGTSLMEKSHEQMQIIDEIVLDSVEKVEGLDEHSKEISELILVIQDIAEQTNLLALNAAIEAARAGEHGQGFAVVADEVRKLAEQVSFSVTDITDIVTRIQNESSVVSSSLRSGYEEVKEGTIQIDETRKTFLQISEAVEEMAERIRHVSGNLETIAKDSEEMSVSIEDIAAISEESAAGVEETSAQSQQASSSMEEVAGSSQDLKKLADDLEELIGQFKL